MTGRLITTREVAEHLGVSTATVLRWHRAGRLRGYRLAAGVLRFREDEIEAWIAARACDRPVIALGSEQRECEHASFRCST